MDSSLEATLQVATLYSHNHDYHVVALLNAPGALHFELYLYSSKTQTWTVKKPVLVLNEQQQQAGEFCHITAEVITVGQDYGTMGFVDHSRGILFCDVLRGDYPLLYYVPLPTPLHHSSSTATVHEVSATSPSTLAVAASGFLNCALLRSLIIFR